MIPGSDSTTGDLEAEQGEPGEEPSDEPCPHPGIRIVFYVWSGNEVIAEYSDSLLDCQYVYANGMRIAQLKKTGSTTKDTTYLHADYQGSTRLTTNRAQTILSQTYYDVWGQVRQQMGSVGNEYTYTGQAWESDLGINLFYLNARYYDPTLGRFTTPDPLPSDLNPYSYCNNNPAMLTDVSGMAPVYLPIAGSSEPPHNRNFFWSTTYARMGSVEYRLPSQRDAFNARVAKLIESYDNPPMIAAEGDPTGFESALGGKSNPIELDWTQNVIAYFSYKFADLFSQISSMNLFQWGIIAGPGAMSVIDALHLWDVPILDMTMAGETVTQIWGRKSLSLMQKTSRTFDIGSRIFNYNMRVFSGRPFTLVFGRPNELTIGWGSYSLYRDYSNGGFGTGIDSNYTRSLFSDTSTVGIEEWFK